VVVHVDLAPEVAVDHLADGGGPVYGTSGPFVMGEPSRPAPAAVDSDGIGGGPRRRTYRETALLSPFALAPPAVPRGALPGLFCHYGLGPLGRRRRPAQDEPCHWRSEGRWLFGTQAPGCKRYAVYRGVEMMRRSSSLSVREPPHHVTIRRFVGTEPSTSIVKQPDFEAARSRAHVPRLGWEPRHATWRIRISHAARGDRPKDHMTNPLPGNG